MGELNQLLNKVKKKKWGKEEWIILILAGAFLMIVFWPSSDKKKQENYDNVEIETQPYIESDDSSYKAQMEQQLEEVLRSIDGIDNVNAMITLSTSEEEVILSETKNTKETTCEEDSQGGNRTIESSSYEETVCYTKSSDEDSKPYITHTIAPKVEGVVIVVGGNRAGLLRTQIVRAVQALFDVESHKVVVIKMKES
ncbi:MAG: hypothetical protein IJ274_06295 [Lachnospiraceae bacterium]|nr:hypothetical protein [Lachnospiraceae bacterium]